MLSTLIENNPEVKRMVDSAVHEVNNLWKEGKALFRPIVEMKPPKGTIVETPMEDPEVLQLLTLTVKRTSKEQLQAYRNMLELGAHSAEVDALARVAGVSYDRMSVAIYRQLYWDMVDDTFNHEVQMANLMKERNRVIAVLSREFPSYRTNKFWNGEHHNVVVVVFPRGPVMWQFLDDESTLFAHLPFREPENSPDWAGYTTEEDYERLRT